MSQVLLGRLFPTLVTLRGPIRGDMCDVFLMWQIMTRLTNGVANNKCWFFGGEELRENF